ncbi:hypothetical protein [Mycolicibacterium moriokaense]|jgi:hypothetical protein|uniref:Uncharacterized protein n=1 Tax=Mycolicibacterium moriokaense TaxID=39691 RepID=A0AAD1HCP5_9MYCO|nr:hypothetical protein [Mycolicibacterium moriokaense]MCV7040746.1 hypothetical protein [Mycolicibacterium moriokaense]BBX02977.1 hypothetical protein MMOR_39130 [Mycolicibacterium moriokaense]
MSAAVFRIGLGSQRKTGRSDASSGTSVPLLPQIIEFAYRPKGGKQNPQPFFATCRLDPWGVMLGAVCHYDRD